MKPLKPNPENERGTKLQQNNSPSPVSYKHEVSYMKVSQTPRPVQWTISKQRKDLFTDRIIKLKAFVPGVGQYSPERTQDSGKLTIGARGKMGYYK